MIVGTLNGKVTAGSDQQCCSSALEEEEEKEKYSQCLRVQNEVALPQKQF